jgi:hypothetical protein
MDVAHDGPADDGPRAGAGGLHEAGDDEAADALGGDAGDAGDNIDRHARQQHRPAPEAIRKRPVEKLTAGKPGQEYAQGQLHLADAGAEGRAQRRQGGQIEIGRERPQRHHRGQEGGDGKAAGMGAHRGKMEDRGRGHKAGA